jgi:hypothetical protein
MWQLGNGENETVDIDFSTHTAGTYTLTFGGETTSAITFSAGTGDSGYLEDALEGLSAIGPGNVHVQRTSTTTIHRILFEGDLACTNVGVITADFAGLGGAGSPSVSVVDQGVVGNAITVVNTANVTQGTNAAAGIDIRCNVTINPTDGIDWQVGPAGLTIDAGATVELKGRVRAIGAASPTTHALPWTDDDLWTVCEVNDCSGNCATNPDELQLLWTAAKCNDPVNPDPGDPYVDEAVTNTAVGDLVAFVPGYGCPDEGWMYEVTATSGAASPTLTIAPMQSVTDQEGLDLVEKELIDTTLSANEAIGSTVINIQDAIVTSADMFTGRWVRIDGDDRMYQIGETSATADTLTLVDRRGLQKAYSSTDSVVIHPDAIHAGCRFVVINPVKISSATTGVTEALQEDTPTDLHGNLDLQWVWFKETGPDSLNNYVATAANSLGPLWYSDGHNGTDSVLTIHGVDGYLANWIQSTGDADDNSGACSDCRIHGIKIRQSISPRIGWYTRRWGADDCILFDGVHGPVVSPTIDNSRCQYSTAASDSGQWVEVYPVGTVVGDVNLGHAECVNCTSYWSDAAPGQCSDCTLNVTGSAFALYMGSWSSLNGYVSNLYAYRLDEPAGGMLPVESRASFFERAHSGTYPLNQATGIRTYNSVYYEPTTDVNGFTLLFAGAADYDYIFDNVAILKPDHPNNVTANQGNVFATPATNTPYAGTHSITDVLVWCDPESLPAGLSVGWRANGPTDITGYEIDGLAFANCQTGQWVRAMWGTDALFADITWGDGPYFYDIVEHANLDASFPSTTLLGGPPGFVDPAELRFDVHPGSALDKASSGIRKRAGVCREKPWHTWAQLPVKHACVGPPITTIAPQLQVY